MQLTEVFKWRMPINMKTFRLDKRLQHINAKKKKGWLPHLQTCECWGIDLTGATSQRCISIDFGKWCTWSLAEYRFVLKTVRKGALCLTELSDPIFLFPLFNIKSAAYFPRWYVLLFIVRVVISKLSQSSQSMDTSNVHKDCQLNITNISIKRHYWNPKYQHIFRNKHLISYILYNVVMTSIQPIRLATRTCILKCRLQLLITVIGNVKFLSVLRMRWPFSLDTIEI